MGYSEKRRKELSACCLEENMGVRRWNLEARMGVVDFTYTGKMGGCFYYSGSADHDSGKQVLEPKSGTERNTLS